jgi:hypothetical protein
MKSSKLGLITSEVEVTNISSHGFWILVVEKEYFLPFAIFPWFRQAKLEELFNVELLNNNHLFWPLLDVDLTLDIIENPDKYPLIFK